MIARSIGYVVAGRNCEHHLDPHDLDPPARAFYRWVLAWLTARIGPASATAGPN